MTENPSGIQVLVFEDEPFQRRSLVRLLEEAGAEVVGQAATADECQALALTTEFDVVILDISRGHDHDDLIGLRIALWFIQAMPQVGVILMTIHDRASYAYRLLQARHQGVGYLVKGRLEDQQILRAISWVHDGRNAFDDTIQMAMLQGQVVESSQTKKLTPREVEVLKLMAEALTTEAIADRLYLSTARVYAIIGEIFGKLDIRNDDNHSSVNARVAAVVHYLRNLQKYQILKELEPVEWPMPRPKSP